MRCITNGSLEVGGESKPVGVCGALIQGYFFSSPQPRAQSILPTGSEGVRLADGLIFTLNRRLVVQCVSYPRAENLLKLGGSLGSHEGLST